MNILVTGHKGYIGPHVIELFQSAGHSVTGVDLALFSGCSWGAIPSPDHEIIKDFRKLSLKELAGHDCVIHLAALSNDPMGDIDPLLTKEINETGVLELAQKCQEAGVSRFLFSGSCSIYGKGSADWLHEDDELAPITTYAKAKIMAEQAILAMNKSSFSTASLRNATAYGYSPMLRIDLVANSLLASGYALQSIQVHSDGTPWRPLVHCRDIARAFVAFAEAPASTIGGQYVNIGGNDENFQVKDIVEVVASLLPDANIEYTGQNGPDPRSYRVSFDKLNRLLPQFKLSYSLHSGLAELLEYYQKKQFSKADIDSKRFIRLHTLLTTRGIDKLRID